MRFALGVLCGALVGSSPWVRAEPPATTEPDRLKLVDPKDPNSTHNRSLRWVLRFRVTDGRDYVAQLRLVGAEILVPLPPDNKEAHVFPDLNDLKKGRTATADDLKRLAGKVKFSDTRREQVAEVVAALGLDAKPKEFWAFFPKELEDELARKEKAYRNRKPEDIEETIFRVTVRAGKLEIVVDDQRVKR